MLTEDLTKIPDLIDDWKSPWHEFENSFEEGWSGEPNVFCLANITHHRQVANLAAYRLSQTVKDQKNFFYTKGWQEIAQKAYNEAARDLYPNERLWSGDHEDDIDFWYWHTHGNIPNGNADFWKKEFEEDYGIAFDEYEPKVSNYIYDIDALHYDMMVKEAESKY